MIPSHSAALADAPVGQNIAPTPCSAGEVFQPAHGSLPNIRAETAAGISNDLRSSAVPAAFSFQPNFENQFNQIMGANK